MKRCRKINKEQIEKTNEKKTEEREEQLRKNK